MHYYYFLFICHSIAKFDRALCAIDSQKKYVENDVNIHYKVPVRYEFKHAIPDDELARQQAEHMKKVYQEERRRKYLQELQDMNNRRHTDNFTPSQKSPIALNRYDDFAYNLPPPSKSPVNLPGTVARALYSFQGQSNRYDLYLTCSERHNKIIPRQNNLVDVTKASLIEARNFFIILKIYRRTP